MSATPVYSILFVFSFLLALVGTFFPYACAADSEGAEQTPEVRRPFLLHSKFSHKSLYAIAEEKENMRKEEMLAKANAAKLMHESDVENKVSEHANEQYVSSDTAVDRSHELMFVADDTDQGEPESEGDRTAASEDPFAFTLGSDAFEEKHVFPVQHTCDGRNRSLPLFWKNVPKDAVSLAFVMVDVDTPRPFYHWLWYDFLVSNQSFAHFHGIKVGQRLRGVARVARNSFHTTTYGGPCPPHSETAHRYQMTLYALDVRLGDDELRVPESVDGATLLAAIDRHLVAATAPLFAVYARDGDAAAATRLAHHRIGSNDEIGVAGESPDERQWRSDEAERAVDSANLHVHRYARAPSLTSRPNHSSHCTLIKSQSGLPVDKKTNLSALRATVFGNVQNVSMRSHTVARAQQLGIMEGYVRNNQDGTVEIFARGDAERLCELIAWAHDGAPRAVVSRIHVSWTPASEVGVIVLPKPFQVKVY